MFSYSTGYYVSPPVDQYLKFKNRCSLLHISVSNVIKVVFLKIVLFSTLWLKRFLLILYGEKKKFLQTFWSPKIAKEGPQTANPQSATFAKSPIIKQIIYCKARKFADLRFAELICGRPTHGRRNFKGTVAWDGF